MVARPGLQAALTLGRMRRKVLLLDSAEYRNRTVTEMHNFLTHDGDDPALLREAARAELKHYDTVEVREGRVSTVEKEGDGWRRPRPRPAGPGPTGGPRHGAPRHAARRSGPPGALG